MDIESGNKSDQIESSTNRIETNADAFENNRNFVKIVKNATESSLKLPVTRILIDMAILALAGN